MNTDNLTLDELRQKLSEAISCEDNLMTKIYQIAIDKRIYNSDEEE